MIRTLPFVSLAIALAMAGCSKEPEPAPSSAASADMQHPLIETTAATDIPSEDGTLAADGAGAGMSEIPETIRGRWGLVAADCTSTKGDAKGLLEVSADQLKFYESVARLGEIKEAGESRIRATFDYTGEGQSWTQDVVLDVQADGKTMIRRDYGKDAMPGPLKYTRCT